MADQGEADDLEERRRRGRELQARVPKPRWPQSPRSRRREERIEAGVAAAEAGCCAAEVTGVVALFAGAVVGVTLAALALRRRRRTG